MMQLSDFFAKFTLHDSVIREILEYPADHRLVFLVELSNYDQPTYTPEQPEVVPRWLMFGGVRDLESKVPLAAIRWDQNVDGEFVEASMENPGRVKVAMKIDNYANRTREFLVLRFAATDVDWRELTKAEREELEAGKLPLEFQL